MKTQTQPTNKDILKGLGYFAALFLLFTIPFMAGWIDSLLKLIFGL